MDFTSLEYFAALQQYDSFSKAADAMFITRQGYGKAICSLESELGVQLVKRDYGGATLTPAGRRLLSHANQLLEGYRAMIFDVLGSEETSSGAMTCYASPFTMESGDALAVSISRERAEIIERPFSELDDYIAEACPNHLMFAEIFPSTLTELVKREDVVFEPYFQAQVGVIWKGDRPFPNAQAVALKDIIDIPLALCSWEVISKTCSGFLNVAALRNVKMRARTWRTLANFVNTPGNVSLFDSYTYRVLVDQGSISRNEVHFAPLAGKAGSFSIGFLYPSSVSLAPECRQYINWTKAITPQIKY